MIDLSASLSILGDLHLLRVSDGLMLDLVGALGQGRLAGGVPHSHIDVQGLQLQASNAPISRLVVVVGGSSELSQPGVGELVATVITQRLQVLHDGIVAMLPLSTELRTRQDVVQVAVDDGTMLALASQGPVSLPLTINYELFWLIVFTSNY